MINHVIDDFRHIIKSAEQALQKQRRHSRILSWIRFLLFIIFLYLLYRGLYDQEPTYFFLAFLAIASYSLLFAWHQRIQRDIQLSEARIQLSEEEIDRQSNKLDLGRNGTPHIEEQHQYSSDLDLFGTGSLYHHINRIEIDAAEKTLAELLINPLSYEKAVQRQETIQSLADQPEWCLNWQATLKVNKPKKALDNLRIDFPEQLNPWLIFASILLTVSTILLSIGSFVLGYSFSIVLGILPFNILLLSFNHRRLLSSDRQLGRLNRQVKQYLQGFHLIKSLPEKSSEELKTVKREISKNTASAWKQLSQLIYFLDSRENLMYWLINPILFLDSWLIIGLYRWGKTNGNHWQTWVDEINWLDCMVSFAGYARLQRAHVYPHLVPEQGVFQSEDLGHPLIPESVRISNSFSFEKENLMLLTGSNMSGKSTFLRTVAISQVMAWVGLPVAAKKLISGPAQVYTSMRTSDNLKESTSSFYAELKRIKYLLEKINTEKDQVVMFFLDEILKGTNSQDRHKGAIGLIQQLISSSAKGFVSTHDLDLAYHFQTTEQLKNYSFNSQLNDGQLSFDYKLTDSICHSTNASDLMMQMGIILPAEKE